MSLECRESAAVDDWFVRNAMSDICGKRMDCEAERSVILVAVLPDHAVPVATRKMMRREDTVYQIISKRAVITKGSTYLNLIDHLQKNVSHRVAQPEWYNEEYGEDGVERGGLDKDGDDVGVSGCVLPSHGLLYAITKDEQSAGDEERDDDVERERHDIVRESEVDERERGRACDADKCCSAQSYKIRKSICEWRKMVREY